MRGPACSQLSGRLQLGCGHARHSTVKLPGEVAPTCAFEGHNIPPDPKHAMDFLILVLKDHIVSSFGYARKSKVRILTMVFNKLALSVFSTADDKSHKYYPFLAEYACGMY
jgi:hypothetical protein